MIACFDWADVFEDFYPHYGVTQHDFATRWGRTATHAFVAALEREVGETIWYSFSISPEVDEARHEVTGSRVKILPSSVVHRGLWKAYYAGRIPWRWTLRTQRTFAVAAAYTSLLSIAFLRSLRRERPDAFFVQDYSSGRFDVLVCIARLMRVPLVAFHAGSVPDHYIGRALKRWSIPRADLLLVSSTAERDIVVSGFAASPERVEIVLTPIDTLTFAPREREAACAKAGLDPKRRHVVYVGRLDDRVKRVGTIIEEFAAAAEGHDDIDLVVVGDGPDRQPLEALARAELGDRVVFRGWIGDLDELANVYNAAECLVLFSVSEGLPTVTAEAMACGTPVVASAVGGVAELVTEGETGWLISPADRDGLRARLLYVAEHAEEVRALRPAVRKRAEERVSHDVVGTRLRGLFAKL